jgi:hypothetical protein
METHVRALSALAVLWLFWTPSYAHAQRFSSMPITLRIEGFVRPEPHGVVPQATWVVYVQGKEYTLQVMRLEVLRGNTDPSQKSGEVNAAPGVLSCASLQRGEGEGTSCRRYRIPLPLRVLATLR